MNQEQEKSVQENNILIEINPEGFCNKANNAVMDHTGYQPRELIGKKFKDFLDIDSNKLHDIESKIASKEGVVVNFESNFRHKTGRPVYMTWTMYWSDQNKSLLCIGKNLSSVEQRFIKENQELHLLNSIHESIQHHTKQQDLFEGVCKVMVKTGRYLLAWVGKLSAHSKIEVLFKESEVYLPNESFDQSPFIDLIFEKGIKEGNQHHVKVIRFQEDEISQLLPKLNLKIKSIILIPLDLGPDKKIYFSVASSDPEGFDEHETSVLERLSKNLSFALKSIQNEENVKSNESSLAKYIHELTLLNEINNHILLLKDESALFKQTLNTLISKGGYKLAWILFFEKNSEKEKVLTPTYFAGETEYANNLHFDLNDPERLKGPGATCILTQKTCIYNTNQDDPNYKIWREKAALFGIGSSITIHLDLKGKEKAIIAIYSGEPDGFDYRETIILERMAKNIVYAIGAIRINSRSAQYQEELSSTKKLIEDYQTVLNDSAIVSIIDANGVFKEINKNFETSFGYSMEHLSGKTFEQMISNFHPTEFWNQLWKEISREKLWSGEIKNIDFNQHEKWYETKFFPFFDTLGKPYQYLCIQQDISDRKALEEKSILVKQLVESSDIAIYSVDLEGVFTSWNASAEALFGYTPEEIIGSKIADFLPEEKIADELEILESLKKGEPLANLDTERRHKNGNTVYVNMCVSPIRDENQQLIGYSKIVSDISGIKYAELEREKTQNEIKIKDKAFWILTKLSRISQDAEKSIPELLTELADLIPKGLQYPKQASVHISYRGKPYFSKNYLESDNFLAYKNHENLNKPEILIYYSEGISFIEEEKIVLDILYHWVAAIVNAISTETAFRKQREKDVNALINLLKDLNNITSIEISHEFHKLQSIVELAQDFDFVDPDLKEIFSSTKGTFQKADAAIKKLMSMINTPLQEEIIVANSLRQIEKIILLDDDEFSSKISSKLLKKSFNSIQIINFISVDEMIDYFKTNKDHGNNMLLVELNLKGKSGWEFLQEYELLNLKSPVIIMSSNTDYDAKQKARGYKCVKNFISKPLNLEAIQAIHSKEIIKWNFQ